MDWQLIIIFSTLVYFVFWIFFILGKSHKLRSHILLTLTILSVVLWTLSAGFASYCSIESALFWLKATFIFTIFYHVFFLCFSINYPVSNNRKILKTIIVAPALIMMAFILFTDQVAFGQLVDGEVIIKVGFGYYFYILFQVVYFFISFFSILNASIKSTGLVRSRLQYMLVGILLGATFSVITYYFFPELEYEKINWGKHLMTFIWLSIISYAIISDRLMDLRIIAKRFFVYFGVSAFIYFIFPVVAIFYDSYFGSIYNKKAYFAGFFLVPIFVIAFHYTNKFLTKFANNYLFWGVYNYEETINKLSKELNHYNDLGKLVGLIIETIIKTMQLSRAGILLADYRSKPVHFDASKLVGFGNVEVSLIKNNFLTKYLENSKKPLVGEELKGLAALQEDSKIANNLFKLDDQMKQAELSLCLPLFSNNQLIGVIILGNKKNGNAYTKEDLDLLETLSYQAGIAIENARLYKETKEFNLTLQQKVDEQTNKIKENASKIEKLFKIRSEFLDVASHQLKTPVSVILGTASMFKEGSLDQLSSKERNKFIDNIYYKAKKLSAIINDILMASEMDTDSFKFVTQKVKPVKVEKLIENVSRDLSAPAREKKIRIIYQKPKKAISPVETDADFLEQAIFNLVDNSIKYTQKGSVKISLNEKSGKVLIKIEDTGIGIPEKNQAVLFDKFSRGENAVNTYTDGTGLGLFIVKKIIKAHKGGEIEFKSKEGKGTIFIISLPAYKGK